MKNERLFPVSVPYEITLLSNRARVVISLIFVSVPYEITLLSNTYPAFDVGSSVSVPYEITLLSNKIDIFRLTKTFQYLMKLHYSQTYGDCSPL